MKNILLMLFIFGICISCQRESKPKPNPKIPPKYVVNQEPKFKRQGTLAFVSSTGKPISSIDIELADTPKKREMGLMYRTSMQENQGMLFIFDAEERQSFWMKNTHLPLDIIFVNDEKTVVHIAENCEPYSLKQIPSFEYARYVVEVNAGYTRKHQILVGSTIKYQIE